MNRISPLKTLNKQPNMVPFINQKVPKTFPITSFPFYDGWLELSLSKIGYNVTGLTNKFVVNEFWNTLESDPKRLYDFISFFEKKPIEEILFFLQKEWFKYKDPFSRSAFFFLLQNCSDQSMASKGNYMAPPKEVKAIVNNWTRGQIKIEFLNYPDDEILSNIVREGSVFYCNCGRLTNELIENNSAGIDETKFSNKLMLELMFKNYDPWILCFEKNDLILDYVGNKCNTYFINYNGDFNNKKTASFCLVTNV